MKRRSLLERCGELMPQASKQELLARIVCGEIRVDGETVRSPGRMVAPEARLEHRPQRRFVSRGGNKLDGVLSRWQLEVAGLSLIDAGASTGGFTDCLLQRGARAVIAVERGYNQLDFRLRRDPRVTVFERTNLMDLATADLPHAVDAAVADLSLRSLRAAAASSPWSNRSTSVGVRPAGRPAWSATRGKRSALCAAWLRTWKGRDCASLAPHLPPSRGQGGTGSSSSS
jgi:23S rRNA (cytidine1920-2'-O)/16S rRNA (cytidine1409-2'-O)-methyltransferase